MTIFNMIIPCKKLQWSDQSWHNNKILPIFIESHLIFSRSSHSSVYTSHFFYFSSLLVGMKIHHNQFSMLPYQKAQIYLLLGCLLDLITCLKLSLSTERITGISSISAQSSPKHVWKNIPDGILKMHRLPKQRPLQCSVFTFFSNRGSELGRQNSVSKKKSKYLLRTNVCGRPPPHVGKNSQIIP